MNVILLLFLVCCFCSCTQEFVQEVRIPSSQKILTNEISGKIVDRRYHSEDSSFSVIAHGADNPETQISESKSAHHLSVAFDVPNYNPTISYDVFPIHDTKAYLHIVFDTDYQSKILHNFFHEIIMPSFYEKQPEIKLLDEDIFADEDGIYYIVILKGDIGGRFNILTGKNSEDFAGVLLSIKDKFLVAITLQNGIAPLDETYMTAKKRLLPLLLQYANDFTAIPTQGQSN